MELGVDELILQVLSGQTKGSIQNLYDAIRVVLLSDDNRIVASQVYGYARRFAKIGIARALLESLHGGLISPSLVSASIELKAVAVKDEICKSIAGAGGIDALLPICSSLPSFMNANMSQETALQYQKMDVANQYEPILHLPNPRIFTIFIISSTVTFSLGIAMIVNWVLYGQCLSGFYWMVYGASAITSLPILRWIICLLLAIRFHASSSNLPKQQQLQTHQQTDTEAAAPAHQDELATMQTEILNNHPSGLTEEQPAVCKSLIPVSQPRNSIDDKQALKQTLSLPLSQVPIDYTNEF